MRLVKCHVENFGKLHDVTLDFQEGLNVFCRENGWGKSTLAAFVRVMLYGFQGESKRSNQENERKRYEPWQGGVYGGSLTFETNGKQYVITRVFRDKTTNDLFELRDAVTNLESNDFSSNIGEELFQINAEAYMRTGFIGQQDCVTNTTDSINAKIGNLTDNTNDLNSYEVADEALKNILNKMNPRVKKGTLHQLQEEITHLKKEVSDGNTLEKSIEVLRGYYEESMTQLDRVKRQKEQIGAKQQEVSRYRDVLAKKDTYDHLCKEVEEKEGLLKEKATIFTNRVPTEQEVRNALQNCTEMERWATEEKHTHLTPEQETEFIRLTKVFSNGLPEKEQLHSALQLARQVEEDSKKNAERKMRPEEEQAYKEEAEYFGCESPSSEINHLLQLWNERITIKSALSLQQASLDMMKRQHMTEQKATAKKSYIKMLLSILILVLGCAILVAGSVLVRGTIMGAGVCLMLIGALLGVFRGKKNRKISGDEKFPLEEEIIGNRKKVEEIGARIESYLRQHKMMYEEETVLTQLQQLLNRALIYENLGDRRKRYACEELTGDIQEKTAMLEKILLPFTDIIPTDISFTEKVQMLMQTCEKYYAEKEKNERNINAAERLKESRFAVLTFLQEIGVKGAEEDLLRNQLQYLLETVSVYNALSDGYQQAKKKKEDYERAYNLEEILAGYKEEDVISLQELQEQFVLLEEEAEQIRTRMKTYEEQLNVLHEQYDEWVATKEMLEIKQAEQIDKKRQYELLGKTKDFLGRAKEALTARYTGPIMEHFLRYYAVVTGKEDTSYHMDANIRMTREEQGLQRDVAFLSAGYQDLTGVCLRLALVDAMYTDEKPMLIMDDPFVNLDEENSVGSKRLMDELAKTYQIIYFTCREMR